jgi:hypothetical protein
MSGLVKKVKVTLLFLTLTMKLKRSHFCYILLVKSTLKALLNLRREDMEEYQGHII